VPAGQVIDQAAQSVTVEPLFVAEPVALQKPVLHTHAAMPAPPGEAFEFAGQSEQVLSPAFEYLPVPHATQELAPGLVELCR
jgi:hypothetical protein